MKNSFVAFWSIAISNGCETTEVASICQSIHFAVTSQTTSLTANKNEQKMNSIDKRFSFDIRSSRDIRKCKEDILLTKLRLHFVDNVNRRPMSWRIDQLKCICTSSIQVKRCWDASEQTENGKFNIRNDDAHPKCQKTATRKGREKDENNIADMHDQTEKIQPATVKLSLRRPTNPYQQRQKKQNGKKRKKTSLRLK